MTLNIWQEPLLKLLDQLGYSRNDISTAIQKHFSDLSEDQKTVFNRAAGYVWKKSPGAVKIFSDLKERDVVRSCRPECDIPKYSHPDVRIPLVLQSLGVG